MNRDIIPLLDNDVLSLIGKEVIKIRDRKTLEYWMEFYTPRHYCLINRLYPDLRYGWRQTHLIFRKLEKYQIGWGDKSRWDTLRTIEYSGGVSDTSDSDDDYSE